MRVSSAGSVGYLGAVWRRGVGSSRLGEERARGGGRGGKVGGGNWWAPPGEEVRGEEEKEGRLEAVVRGATVYNSCHRPRANRPCPQLSQSCLNLTSPRPLDDQVSSTHDPKESRLFELLAANSSPFAKIRFDCSDGSPVCPGTAADGGVFARYWGCKCLVTANSIAARQGTCAVD